MSLTQSPSQSWSSALAKDPLDKQCLHDLKSKRWTPALVDVLCGEVGVFKKHKA